MSSPRRAGGLPGGHPGRLVGSRRAPRLRQLRRRRPQLRPRRGARGRRGDRDADDPGDRRRRIRRRRRSGIVGAGSPATSSCSRSPARRPSAATTWRPSSGSPAGQRRLPPASASRLGPCEVPGAGRPTFEIGPDEIEIGMGDPRRAGISARPPGAGRRGRRADSSTAILADRAATGEPPAADVALLVNGLGATAYLDLYIVYRATRRLLEAAGCRVAAASSGST